MKQRDFRAFLHPISLNCHFVYSVTFKYTLSERNSEYSHILRSLPINHLSLLHEFQLLSLISRPHALLNQFLIICISINRVHVRDPILSQHCDGKGNEM